MRDTWIRLTWVPGRILCWLGWHHWYTSWGTCRRPFCDAVMPGLVLRGKQPFCTACGVQTTLRFHEAGCPNESMIFRRARGRA